MMLALLALSMFADQFTVQVLPSVPRFTVVVIEPIASAKPVVQAAKRVEWYLVSETWCGPCGAAKKRFLALGWPAVNIITIDECDRRFGFRPKAIPFEFKEPGLKEKVAAKQMSHAEMVQLHNQLHGGRSHTWPGDLETHLRTTHGQNLTKE